MMFDKYDVSIRTGMVTTTHTYTNTYKYKSNPPLPFKTSQMSTSASLPGPWPSHKIGDSTPFVFLNYHDFREWIGVEGIDESLLSPLAFAAWEYIGILDVFFFCLLYLLG